MLDQSHYLTRLVEFASGVTPLDEFYRWNTLVLTSEAPEVSSGEGGELTARFSFPSEAAMYLDMVADRDGLDFDETEARRLAGALAALFVQVPDDDLRSGLAHLARWAPDTIGGILEYLPGEWNRPRFETWVSRRPWPAEHKALVRDLSRTKLRLLVDSLAKNDFAALLLGLEE